MGQVWLKDVAAAAGVSVSAASHALRGTGNLAAGTRKRIEEVAQRLGYERDAALSAIAARRWQVGGKRRYARVGFISVIREAERMRSTGGIDVEELVGSGRAHGMEIDRHSVIGTQGELAGYLKRIDRMGYEGLLILNSDAEDWLSEMAVTRQCVLGLNDLPSGFAYHRVETDWGHAVRECYERLQRAGCRRIGAALPKHNVRTAQERVRIGAYYSEAAVDVGGAVLPILESRLGAEDGEQTREMLAWYERHRPDGIVFWLPNPLRGLMAAGVAIPGQVQAACIAKKAEEWYAPFGGVMLGPDLLAMEAARLVFEMLVHRRQGRPTIPICHRLRMPWSPGTSVRQGG